MNNQNNQTNILIEKIRNGNNKAWEELISQYKGYIHSRARKKINGLNVSNPQAMEEELFAAGWIGFVSALRNHDTSKGSFTTYATYYIDGEMSKQLDFEFNSLGLTHRPPRTENSQEPKVVRVHAPFEEEKDKADAFDAVLSRAILDDMQSGISVDAPVDHEKFGQARRVLQILEVLKKLTDEDHSLSKTELLEQLHYYRIAKYSNDSTLTKRKKKKSEKKSPDEDDYEIGLHSEDNTYTSDLVEMLREMNPLNFTGDNEGEYRIRYSGYKEDALYKKLNKKKGQKAPVISDFSYTHDFDNETLDKLIQLVSFSDMFSYEEKAKLIDKLVATASVYYKTPFADGDDLRFNPAAIHGRFAKRNGADRKQLTENLKTIQYAINNLIQIRFKFNRYTFDHKLVPKYERMNILSPYHMVVYHDNYYVIGLNQAWGDKRVLHYRIDLMSDIEIVKDDEGKVIPIEVCAFSGLPISNAYWDPEKYMSQHINMAYDEPRDIRIKIKEDSYTLVHDWFGDHYKKVDSVTETEADGKKVNYDIVVVRTSPFMMVHWAMQYGTAVEIMDEEIREKIREELEEMSKIYE